MPVMILIRLTTLVMTMWIGSDSQSVGLRFMSKDLLLPFSLTNLLSLDFKQFSVNTNVAQPTGFCSDIIQGINSQTHTVTPFNWYEMFCSSKPDKACLIAESGAAYHPNIQTGTASQLQIQQAWWQDCITNTTFMDTFPRIRLHMHFEYEKMEADIGAPDLRDYRLTNSTDVLAAYQTDLTTVQDRYAW